MAVSVWYEDFKRRGMGQAPRPTPWTGLSGQETAPDLADLAPAVWAYTQAR